MVEAHHGEVLHQVFGTPELSKNGVVLVLVLKLAAVSVDLIPYVVVTLIESDLCFICKLLLF